MTAQEAIQIAEEKAKELKAPWSSDEVSAKHWGLWPLSASWKVTSYVSDQNAETIILVNGRNRRAFPKRVIYHTPVT